MQILRDAARKEEADNERERVRDTPPILNHS